MKENYNDLTYQQKIIVLEHFKHVWEFRRNISCPPMDLRQGACWYCEYCWINALEKDIDQNK